MVNKLIHVSAVVLRDSDGEVLMVRKRGTDMWMNPGGKPEHGEDGAQCAVREVGEELGLLLDAARLEPLGERCAPAANEDGWTVTAQLYLWPEPVGRDVVPAAEIEALRWITPSDLPDATLAPLFVDGIAPLLGEAWLG